MAENYEFRRLRAIFDSDGSEIREQFIFAGLLLTIFERFKKYVVDHVDWYLHDLSAPIEMRYSITAACARGLRRPPSAA